MQARCPHCQSVFSTERAGVQFCPSCGQQVDVPGAAAAVSPPPAPLPGGLPPGEPSRATAAGTPWERRTELGFFPALLETLKQVLVDPVGFFTAMRPDGSWTEALFFAWLLTGVSTLLGLPLRLVGMGAGMGQMQEALQKFNLPAEQAAQLQRALSGMTGVGLPLCTAVAYPLFLIIGAGIVHVCCMITGAAKNGYYATLRVMGYAAAPLLLSFIPCVGGIAAIYYYVLVIIGVWKAHETTPMRAAFGVLLPLIVVCCCCGGIGAAAMMAAAAQVKSHL